MERLNLNFYYGQEADQFTFFRLPKLLITDERFADLSNNAKLLYGLMLDRMSLSALNGWYDEQNRVYIHYSLNGVMKDLHVKRDLAISLIKELDDIGLIDTYKQAGKTTIIYVKNFVGDTEAVGNSDQSEKSTSRNNRPVTIGNHLEEDGVEKIAVGKTDQYMPEYADLEDEPVGKIDYSHGDSLDFGLVGKIDQSDISTTSGRKNRRVLVGKIDSNNNNSNDTELINNNHINLSTEESQQMDEMDKINQEALAYIEIIKENIEYDIMMSSQEWQDRDMYNELFEIICDVVCVPKKSVRIGGENYPYNLVKSKFLKLNSSHLQYVIGCMQRNTTKVSNIRAYLITALYNAPNTMGHYYSAEVSHDLYGVG